MMQPPSILLVEDSEDDAFLFTHTFKGAGLQASLHYANDGSQAIHFLSQASNSGTLPQVMFLDLKMPVANGFDVLEWLRKQPFCTQVSVFVLSGSELQADKERASQLGAAGYFVKPLKRADLIQIIGNNSLKSETSADTGTGARP